MLSLFVSTPEPLELFASYQKSQPLELIHYNVDLNINTLHIHDIHDQIFGKGKKNQSYMGYSIYLQEINSHIIFSHEKNCSGEQYRQINLGHVKKFILNNMYLFPDKNIKVDFSGSGNTGPKYSYTVQQILDLPLTKFPYQYPDPSGREVDQLLPNYKIEIGKKLERGIKFKFNQEFESVKGVKYLEHMNKIDKRISPHVLYFEWFQEYYTTGLTMECGNVDIYNHISPRKYIRFLDGLHIIDDSPQNMIGHDLKQYIRTGYLLIELDITSEDLNTFPVRSRSYDFVYDLNLFYLYPKLYDQYIQIYRSVDPNLYNICETAGDEGNFKMEIIVIEMDGNLTMGESIIDGLLSLCLKGDNKTGIGYLRNTIVNNIRINYNKGGPIIEANYEYEREVRILQWVYYTYLR